MFTLVYTKKVTTVETDSLVKKIFTRRRTASRMSVHELEQSFSVTLRAKSESMCKEWTKALEVFLPSKSSPHQKKNYPTDKSLKAPEAQ